LSRVISLTVARLHSSQMPRSPTSRRLAYRSNQRRRLATLTPASTTQTYPSTRTSRAKASDARRRQRGKGYSSHARWTFLAPSSRFLAMPQHGRAKHNMTAIRTTLAAAPSRLHFPDERNHSDSRDQVDSQTHTILLIFHSLIPQAWNHDLLPGSLVTLCSLTGSLPPVLSSLHTS